MNLNNKATDFRKKRHRRDIMAYHGYTQAELTQLSKTIIERVSRFRKFLDGLIMPSDAQRIELNMRMDRIRPLYEKFDEIASLLEKESVKSSRAEFEDLYFKSLALAENISEREFVKVHEMTDYKILNNKRISYQSRLADFNDYIRELRRKKLSSSQFLELRMSIDRVEPMYKEYEEIQLKLESVSLLPTGDTPTTEFEADFHRLLAKSRDLLSKENSNSSDEEN